MKSTDGRAARIDSDAGDLSMMVANASKVVASIPTKTNLVEWARKNHLYLAQNDLARMLQDDSLPVRVFDVRDEDAVGGRVKGAVHCGEAQLGKPEILHDLAWQALRLGEHGLVVFHCMESLRRGPRAGYRLTQVFAQLPSDAPKPKIRILQGGADQWMRTYWNTSLVEDYDDEYWGYKEFPPQDVDSIPGHRLYTVPNDGLSPLPSKGDTQKTTEKGSLCL